MANEDKSNKKIEKMKKQLQEQEEKNLRIQAEMMNMSKRHKEELLKANLYDGENVILNILPIVDNFERAVNLDNHDLNDELSKFLSGFKMIYGNLTNYLKTIEVIEIKALNEIFDPNCMEAVSIDNVLELENDVVVDVFQKGYRYKDKVIRPAIVKVNKKEIGEMKNE